MLHSFYPGALIEVAHDGLRTSIPAPGRRRGGR
jgi:hypothetical protein